MTRSSLAMPAKICSLGRPHALRQCNGQSGQDALLTVPLRTLKGCQAASIISHSAEAPIRGVICSCPLRPQILVNVGRKSSHADVSLCSAQISFPSTSTRGAGRRAYHISRLSPPPNARCRPMMASDPPQQATTLRVAVDVDEGEGLRQT